MPIPVLAAAGIAAAAQAGSSLIANRGGKKSQERANQFNVEQWNRQNEYNDPQAQMSRLKAAGLNPNLIYGTSPTSAVGNAGSVAPAKAAPYNFDNPLREINTFANLKQTEAQTDNLKNQNTVLTQEAILKAAQTANLGVNTAKSKFDLGLAEELKNTSIQAAQANVKKMETDTFGTVLDNQVKSQTVKDQVMRIKYGVEQAKSALKGQELQNQLNEFELELNKLGINKNDNLFMRILGRNIPDTKSIKNWWERLDNPEPKN